MYAPYRICSFIFSLIILVSSVVTAINALNMDPFRIDSTLTAGYCACALLACIIIYRHFQALRRRETDARTYSLIVQSAFVLTMFVLLYTIFVFTQENNPLVTSTFAIILMLSALFKSYVDIVFIAKNWSSKNDPVTFPS